MLLARVVARVVPAVPAVLEVGLFPTLRRLVRHPRRRPVRLVLPATAGLAADRDDGFLAFQALFDALAVILAAAELLASILVVPRLVVSSSVLLSFVAAALSVPSSVSVVH